MKRMLCMLMALMLAMSGIALAEGSFTPGTYEAEAQGFGGPVKVTVTVTDNEITEVAIVGESETPTLGGVAVETMGDLIVAAQSLNVDMVSGATVTSKAIIAAATEALAAAGADIAALTKGVFTPGTYEAEAQGFGGPVKVTVTVTDNEITDVTIVGESETPSLGGVAVETMGDLIVAAQTPHVDTVSGATVTSAAIIAAATEALEAAGADIAALDANRRDAAEDVEKVSRTVDVDVVIVGAGGAGMTAAITVKQAGLSVLVLEKMPYVGGNTTKATGGMNAAETHYQAEQGIEDSVAQFILDTMAGGHNINDVELVGTMAKYSADAIDWLDEIGAPLPKVSFSGGATNARIHSPEDGSGVGEYLVAAFNGVLKDMGIDVMLNTTATKLITNDGAVTGVEAESASENLVINAKAVILATGGFGANEDMYTQYRPDLKGTVTTNAPGATGDGIVMALAVGADLVDIEQIQLHPTVEQTTSMLITEGVRGDGAILVNQSGERFINEMETRDVVSAAELEQEGCYAYVIFDQNLRNGLKAIEKYVNNGLTVQADTIEELAEKLSINPDILAKTLADWNAAVANGKDEAFGRDTGMEHDLSVAPYYAIQIAPGIHHTMGGVKIDTEAHVINTDGEAIPGLFAAGEVTGGVHGGNRIGGNAVADIVVFGRIAAESAIAYCAE